MVDNNITMFGYPGSFQPYVFNLSQDPAYNKLAETYHIADTWDKFGDGIEYYIHEKGTHAYAYSYLTQWELDTGKWWKSTEAIPGIYPYGGWISRINWYLNEVIS